MHGWFIGSSEPDPYPNRLHGPHIEGFSVTSAPSPVAVSDVTERRCDTEGAVRDAQLVVPSSTWNIFRSL